MTDLLLQTLVIAVALAAAYCIWRWLGLPRNADEFEEVWSVPLLLFGAIVWLARLAGYNWFFAILDGCVYLAILMGIAWVVSAVRGAARARGYTRQIRSALMAFSWVAGVVVAGWLFLISPFASALGSAIFAAIVAFLVIHYVHYASWWGLSVKRFRLLSTAIKQVARLRPPNPIYVSGISEPFRILDLAGGQAGIAPPMQSTGLAGFRGALIFLRKPVGITFLILLVVVVPVLLVELKDRLPSFVPGSTASRMSPRVSPVDLAARLRADGAPTGTTWTEMLKLNIVPPYRSEQYPKLPLEAYTPFAQTVGSYLPNNVDRLFWTAVWQFHRSNRVQFAAVPGGRWQPDRLIIDLSAVMIRSDGNEFDPSRNSSRKFFVDIHAPGKDVRKLADGTSENNCLVFKIPSDYAQAVRRRAPWTITLSNGRTVPVTPGHTTLTLYILNRPNVLGSRENIAEIVMEGPPMRHPSIGTPEMDWLKLLQFLATVRAATGN